MVASLKEKDGDLGPLSIVSGKADQGRGPSSLAWNSLPVKLGRYSVLVAVSIGLLFSLIQVGIDFRNERHSIHASIGQLLAILEKSAAEAAYQLDEPQGRKVVDGLFVFPSVYRAEIVDDFGDTLVREIRGEPTAVPGLIARFLMGQEPIHEIVLQSEGNQPVGTMRIWLDLDLLTENFRSRVWFIVLSGMLRNLFLTAVLAVMFHLLLARPLIRAVASLREPRATDAAGDPPANDESKTTHHGSYAEIGTTFMVEIPEANEADELGQLLSAINEFILDREHATAALKDSEKRYRTLVENVPVAVYRTEPGLKGKFLMANPTFLKMFGLDSEEELKEMLAADVYVNPDERKVFLENIQAKEKAAEVELLFKRKDETPFWGSVSARIMDDDSGKGSYFDCTIIDITDRKQAEEALRKSEEKLARSNKMEAMGLMAGGIAHDLNNILSGIVSYPELILMDLPEDSPLRKPIKTIQESGMRATDVVEDLLTIARGVASGQQVLNLNTAVEEYLGSAEHQKLERIHPLSTFKTELDSGLLNITCSASHVNKGLMNLVTNASEAIEGSGTVTISTENRYLDEPLKGYEDVVTGEYVVLTVSDDGLGISPQDLERIFEPFYTKKVMGRSGTGLGLAVVWNMVQDHDGYINVNTSKKGAKFELYFPVTRDELAAEGEAVPVKDYMGNGERVLVVDDEERQRVISYGILTKLGYDAEAVSSGEEAIEYMKEKYVDLVVLDMIMPKGINGRETYEKIIEIHPDQKAIIASGYAETADVKKAQKLGAGKYIKKPYTMEKIGLAVKEELDK